MPEGWKGFDDLKPPEPEFIFWYNCEGKLIKLPLADERHKRDQYYYMGSFRLKRRPWLERIGLNRLNLGLDALLTLAVIIIAHMLGFWRDREERRLLRVELLDRSRKGRKLWT